MHVEEIIFRANILQYFEGKRNINILLNDKYDLVIEFINPKSEIYKCIERINPDRND